VRSFVRVNDLTPGVMEEGNFYSSQVHHNDNCIYLKLFILSKFHLNPSCLCEKFGHKHLITLHIISPNMSVSVLLIYIFISGIVQPIKFSHRGKGVINQKVTPCNQTLQKNQNASTVTSRKKQYRQTKI